MSEVQEEVSRLREEVGRLSEELLMHRKVLEQCLELRESVTELLEHREALLQCLELRDGMQILGEVVDRTSELDLSLAGVSDNTARHGRAIASLTEQQQRTTQTMDAVIRAVKRLDRSRSRQARPTSTTPSELASGRSRTSRGEGEEEKWSRAEDANGAVNGPSKDPWYWPDWDDARPERPKSAPRRIRGTPGGYPNTGPVMESERQELPAQARLPIGPIDSMHDRPTSQMADCVQGVLSRINEALTKLDRSSQDLPTVTDGGVLKMGNLRNQNEEGFAEPLMSHRGRCEAKSPALVTPRAFVSAAKPQDPSRRVADSWA